jgi:hypothetical protein
VVVGTPESSFREPSLLGQDSVTSSGSPREGPPRTPGSPGNFGVPEPILTACGRYASWRELFRRQGLSQGEADALILEKAEEAGGVALADETINLTLWSQRMRVPRPVLEALVLLGVRERGVASPSAAQPVMYPPEVEVISSGSEPWTPAPPALRSPHAPPPSSRHA